MGCKEVALEADASVVKQSPAPAPVLVPKPAGPTEDVEMVDGTQTSPDGASKPTRELLYRCFTCRRLAHYCHLPIPDIFDSDDPASIDDIQLASFYQFETGWRCADCFSYEYTVDKILAWRPYPVDAVEPHYSPTNLPDAKSMLPREYLVKWSERSYRRTQWVPHMWLASTSLMKLKNFIATGPKVKLLDSLPEEKATEVDSQIQPITFETSVSQTPEVEPGRASYLGPLPDAECYIPPAWKTTDRVLDVLLWKINLPGRGKKKGKQSSVLADSEEVTLPDELQGLVVKSHLKGEQPSDDHVENVNDFLRTIGKPQLEITHIKFVAWAFIKWDDLGYDEGEYILACQLRNSIGVSATWDAPPRPDEPGYAAFEAAFQRFIDSANVVVRKSDKDIKKLDSRVRDGYGKHALRRTAQPQLGQDNQLQLMPFQVCPEAL